MRVEFNDEQKRWWLTWQDLSLVMQLHEGSLVNEYFGPKRDGLKPPQWGWLPDERPYPDPIRQSTSEANVQLAPADHAVKWTLHSWSQPDEHEFVLTLAAQHQPLQSELRFSVDAETGLLRRRALLRLLDAQTPVDVSHAGNSFSLCLPADVERALYLIGRWGAETQVRQTPVSEAPLLLESRAGKTGFEFAPYLALHAPEQTYLCQLAWSGNWQLYLRRLFSGRVLLAGGLNPWGFQHQLQPGEELHLPEALLLCVAGDLNAATQRLHDYRRRQRPDPDRLLPVHFNTWYPYGEQPQVDRMKPIADKASQLGCESFVVDAGWYTTEVEDPNENWWIRTGDWVINRRMFPNGLNELSDHCHALGMGFGVWFESEAVGPGSRVWQEHPEWLHHLDGNTPSATERAILHLGVPAARAYIRQRVLSVLDATDAAWHKWDFNTDLRQGGWSPALPSALTHEDPLIAHYRGLYQLQDELRSARPEMVLEMCAGGGGRLDAEVMAHAHTYWISDQTGPLQNLAIHFGSQLAHPAIVCNDWLVEWPVESAKEMDPRGDLAFRLRVAMLGTFGISAPLEKWSDADMAIVQIHVTWYRQFLRPLVHWGDQYLLSEAPPLDGNGEWAAIWYAAKDKRQGALYAFRLASQHSERSFSLPGLDPQATYRLSMPEGLQISQSGAALAQGFTVSLPDRFCSALYLVEQIDL